MKRGLIFLCALLTFILSCDNPLEMPKNAAAQNIPAAEAGYGRIVVKINGASARTVFPTMTFAKYEYFFAKVTNGTPGAPQAQAPVDGYFTLELGDWQLTVKAYAQADDTVPAATGTSATFTVTNSGVAQVAVLLNGNAGTGEGKFAYTITYPEGAAINVFSLKNLQNDAVVDISASGANPLSGSRTVSAGYYFLTIQLTESGGGRTTGANEVVYIYDRLDSEYSKTFTVDDFSHIHEWGNWETTAPTCTTAGWDTRTCAHNAGHTDTREGDPINPDAHDWNESYTTIPATETVNGVKAIMCKRDSLHTKDEVFSGEYATGTAGLSFTFLSINGIIRGSVSRGTATGAVHIPAYRLYNGNYIPVVTLSSFANTTTGQNTVTSVTFAVESQLTTINQEAFFNCVSLTSINIPDSVTSIGGSAFRNCTSLTSITIPDSVTSIGGGVFSSCSSLTSINIPASVTSIGSSAFSNCTNLTSINIPASVTSIGGSAFSNCTNLTSINIPASVTSIGSQAFYNCSSLTNITVDVNNPTYASQDGIVYDKAKTSVLIVPAGISGSVTIPSGVTTIGDNAFQYCSSLTSVNIPDSVTSISNYAFQYCSSLTSINIPASVTSIGGSAFYGCSSLASINIPASVTSIGGSAFSSCSSLTSITIPDSVTSIGASVFSGCRSLTSVTIPEGVTSIGFQAFNNCSSLTSVTIPEGVTSIGFGAFQNCSSLTSVTIPEGVTSIGGYVFTNCTSLTSVTFEGTIASGSFSSNNPTPFPGDLQMKFYATDSANGTPGTYTTTNPGPSAVWTLQ